MVKTVYQHNETRFDWTCLALEEVWALMSALLIPVRVGKLVKHWLDTEIQPFEVRVLTLIWPNCLMRVSVSGLSPETNCIVIIIPDVASATFSVALPPLSLFPFCSAYVYPFPFRFVSTLRLWNLPVRCRCRWESRASHSNFHISDTRAHGETKACVITVVVTGPLVIKTWRLTWVKLAPLAPHNAFISR